MLVDNGRSYIAMYSIQYSTLSGEYHLKHGKLNGTDNYPLIPNNERVKCNRKETLYLFYQLVLSTN